MCMERDCWTRTSGTLDRARAQRARRALRRAVLMTAASLLLVPLMLGSVATAQEMTSPSFRLRGATLSGGGSVDLQSAAPGTTLGPAGTTIGQSSPLGVSEGPTSGVRLEAGFWPIAATPVPEPSSVALLLGACVGLAVLARRHIRV
jgi:hypothetical protein